jgi:hypothetical protein
VGILSSLRHSVAHADERHHDFVRVTPETLLALIECAEALAEMRQHYDLGMRACNAVKQLESL